MEYIALVIALIMLAFTGYIYHLCSNLHKINDIIAQEKLFKKIKFWRAILLITLGVFIVIMCKVTP